jgi:hypothetical protein
LRLINLYASMTSGQEDFNTHDLERRDRQFGYFGLSYHYVIERDGKIVEGRPHNVPSPHDEGIAICLIGGADKDGGPYDNFSDNQKTATVGLVDRLQRQNEFPKVVSRTPSIGQTLLDNLYNRHERTN